MVTEVFLNDLFFYYASHSQNGRFRKINDRNECLLSERFQIGKGKGSPLRIITPSLREQVDGPVFGRRGGPRKGLTRRPVRGNDRFDLVQSTIKTQGRGALQD
jgi:hypothetical protein